MTTEIEAGIHPALQELVEIAPRHRHEIHAWAQRWIDEVVAQEVVSELWLTGTSPAPEAKRREHIELNLLRRLAMALRGLVRIESGESRMAYGIQQFTARLLVLRDTPSKPAWYVRLADERG